MIKLKENVTAQMLEGYGFKQISEKKYRITVGALYIYANVESRLISGVGFFPVGSRVVMETLNIVNNDFVKNCIN